MARPPITRSRPYTPSRGAFADRTFTTEREYRNALAQRKGYASFAAEQRTPRIIKSRHALLRLGPRETEDRVRALDAVSKLRRGDAGSLTAAARQAGTTPNAVRKWAGDALERDGSRYKAKPTDRLARSMKMLAGKPYNDEISVIVTDSRTASKIARHHAAVWYYLDTGDDGRLRQFRRQYITIEKRHIPFLTDTAAIDMLASRGLLSFESIYAQAA